MTETFTTAERQLIRFEFIERFGMVPTLDEGLQLPRWAAGPLKGQPKLKAAVQSMLDRGLVEIYNPERGIPSAKFTAAGIEALKAMAQNQTLLPPSKYGHLIAELRNRASPAPQAAQPARPRRAGKTPPPPKM